MAEYILKADAVDAIQKRFDGALRAGQSKLTVREAVSRIKALEGMDAVPAETIVHCKDCEWYAVGYCRCLHPMGIIGGPVGPLFYCKNGEERRHG